MTTNVESQKDLIAFLDLYLVQKAPFQIPQNVKEWIVKFGPWITVVLLVLTLPALLFALGLGAVVLPFGGVAYARGFTLVTIMLLVQIGLMVAALPGLFARKMSGWRLLFYSQIAAFLFSLLGGSIVGAIIGAVIGLYILFQIRTLYTA